MSASVAGLPVIRAAFERTVRLVSSARLREAALRPLVERPEDLDALSEIEGATSGRLGALERGVGAFSPRDFVHDVPHAAFINASFAYAKPDRLNRFNGPSRGAWYSALEVETCLAEVSHHMANFLADAGRFDAIVDYAEMFASLAGEFVDVRGARLHACLSPDPAVGYPAGNAVADSAFSLGLNGVIYPSVRHVGGTCIVALRPYSVQSVAQGGVWRLRWAGERQPAISRVEDGQN